MSRNRVLPAALLATGLVGLPMSQAVGIFLFSSLLTTICGLSGSFQKLMQYMPRSIAGAMLGGSYDADGQRLPFFWLGALLQQLRQARVPAVHATPVMINSDIAARYATIHRRMRRCLSDSRSRAAPARW